MKGVVAFAFLALAVPVLSTAVPPVARTDDTVNTVVRIPEVNRAARDEEPKKSTRLTSIINSNMPTTWQVEAARLTEEAFEFQTTDSRRLSEVSELFSETHPFWYWQVALNYRYIYHRNSEYWLHLLVDNDHIYMFSTV